MTRIVIVAALALTGCAPNPNNPNHMSTLDMMFQPSGDTNPADGMVGSTYSVGPGPFGTTRVYDGSSRWVGTYTPRR